MQYKKGQKIEVSIEKLAFGGRGIGHYDNRIVFVPDTVPGDLVECSLSRIKPKFFEAKLTKIKKPSDKRIKPKCKHFDTCGGCTLQYLPYKTQLAIKESQVREALEHIGGFRNAKVEPIIGCDEPWFYRNKMEFSFYKNMVGLHPKGYRYEVFDLEECFLESTEIAEILVAVRKIIKDGLLSIIIKEGKRTNERLINLIYSDAEINRDEFVKLMKPFATSIYITQKIAKRGQKTQFIENHLYGKKTLTEKMCGLTFEILPQAFFQPNTLQAEKLYKIVADLGEIGPKDIVFDLFCGTGTIGMTLAHKAKMVFGADTNKSAIENAQQNAKLNKIHNIEFYAGDAYKTIKELDIKPDTVIVDPPRCGLSKKLTKKLAKLKPKRIVYVSCNPTTQARDLQILKKGGYKLLLTQPVDMAPHTSHIETVAKLIYNRSWSRFINLIKRI
ncbi:23S rRNA (uracil(1939)-C(5))-methyltransferase RlmD [Patescibacteria group bacterium]